MEGGKQLHDKSDIFETIAGSVLGGFFTRQLAAPLEKRSQGSSVEPACEVKKVLMASLMPGNRSGNRARIFSSAAEA